MQRNERTQFGGGVFGNGAAQLLQLFARGFNGRVKTRHFAVQFVFGQMVLRQFGNAAYHQMGAPDGNAFAGGITVQHHHDYSPSPK